MPCSGRLLGTSWLHKVVLSYMLLDFLTRSHAPPEEEKKPPTKKSPHLPHLPHLPHIPHPHFGKKKKTSSEDSTEDNGSSQVAAEGAANVPETVEEQPSDTQPQEGAVESGPSDTSISVTQ